MKRAAAAFAFIAALASAGALSARAETLVATVGKPAPAFLLEDLSGGPLSARAFRGKPLFINVFATWCPPCRVELPGIVRSYTDFHERVSYLGVDEQEPAGTVRPFARRMHIRYSLGIDQGQMEASFRAHSVPTSVFIDRRGVVRAIFSGPIPEVLLRRNLAAISDS